jgi:hypothetical protein
MHDKRTARPNDISWCHIGCLYLQARFLGLSQILPTMPQALPLTAATAETQTMSPLPTLNTPHNHSKTSAAPLAYTTLCICSAHSKLVIT